MAVSGEDPGVSTQSLQIVVSVDWQDVVSWQDRASCHGREALFDLPHVNGEIGESGEENYDILSRHLEEVMPVARDICHACPVFDECWIYSYTTLPVGVIRAGAAMSTFVSKQRKRKLEASLVEHQRRIRTRVKRTS